MSEISSTLCGFQAANVVVSDYNWNGTCKCLGCPGCACHNCEQYKALQKESFEKEEFRLERCVACLKQR